MNRSYELVSDLMDMFKNSGSLCLDITYKDNNIYMNTIKYNQLITSTAETIMNENMKLLRDNPDVLFLINVSINKTSYINSDQRIVNNCLWFNVIKNLNLENGYDITYDDVKNFKEIINFNGHTYKIAHCMVFDGYNARFKILNYKNGQKYIYSDYIDNKEELSKIFRGENQNKFSLVNGTIDPKDHESYVPVYIRTTPKSSLGTFNFPTPAKPTMTFGTTTPAPGSFNFPLSKPPPTFGTTTPASGTFNFPAPAKPTMTFGTTTPASGSFNFPLSKPPPTFGTTTPVSGIFNIPLSKPSPTFGTTTPTTGMFNLPPIKPQKGLKAKSNRKKKMLKKTIKKARIVKIKIIKKKECHRCLSHSNH